MKHEFPFFRAALRNGQRYEAKQKFISWHLVNSGVHRSWERDLCRQHKNIFCQRYGLLNQTWAKTTTHQLEFAVEEAVQEVITVFTHPNRVINYGCSINPDSKPLLALFRSRLTTFSWFWIMLLNWSLPGNPYLGHMCLNDATSQAIIWLRRCQPESLAMLESCRSSSLADTYMGQSPYIVLLFLN